MTLIFDIPVTLEPLDVPGTGFPSASTILPLEQFATETKAFPWDRKC